MHIEALDHVGLAVADRAAAERFFGETLGLERDSAGRFRLGRGGFELLDVGSTDLGTEGIDHLGLRVGDLGAAAAELNSLGVPTRLGEGCADGAVATVDPAGTAGVGLRLIQRSSPDDRSVTGADGLVERIDHIGVASTDNARVRGVFVDRLGLVVESSQTDTEVRIPTEFFVSDKYGVVFRTRPAEAAAACGSCSSPSVTASWRSSRTSSRPRPDARRPSSARPSATRAQSRGSSRRAGRASTTSRSRCATSAPCSTVWRLRGHADRPRGRPGSRARAQIAFLHLVERDVDPRRAVPPGGARRTPAVSPRARYACLVPAHASFPGPCGSQRGFGRAPRSDYSDVLPSAARIPSPYRPLTTVR